MRQMGDVDDLYDIRNYFFIGNFQQCINEAQKVRTTSTENQLEKDVFLYRAYIAQKKYNVVKDEISDASPIELQAIKFLADYFSSKAKKDVAESFYQRFKSYESTNYYIMITAVTIYLNEGEIEQALRILNDVDELETMAIVTQIYLKIYRVDLARKEVNKMQEKDEDAILTQLAQAWLNIHVGQDKFQDAYYILQELIDKYGSTPSLLNAQAACFICQEKFEEAESVLQESMGKDSNNADTLINLIVLSGRMKKQPEIANRYLMQLKDSHSETQFIKDYLAKEIEFDKLRLEYDVPSS